MGNPSPPSQRVLAQNETRRGACEKRNVTRNKKIFAKYVNERRSGKKRRKLTGVKRVIKELKAGRGLASQKTGRKRSVRTPSVLQRVQAYVDKRPDSQNKGSHVDIAKKFNLSKGTVSRILLEDLGTKALRKVKKTKLSEKK